MAINKNSRKAQRSTRSSIITEILEQRMLLTTTYTVTSLADLSATTNTMTLRRAAYLASQNSSLTNPVAIQFDPSLFTASGQKVLELTLGEIKLSNYVVIKGPGASKLAIDGTNNSNRAFLIESDSQAFISDLTIQNFGADALYITGAQGGAIFSAGLTLHLAYDTFSDNQVTGDASYSDGPTAVAQGGAVYTTGGLSVLGCTFSDNLAYGADAGVNSDTHVQDPGEPADGGAIAATSSVDSIAIDSSIFEGNQAQGGANDAADSQAGNAAGGAIWSQVNVSIASTTFSSNLATGGNNTANETSAAGIAGTGQGGAVFCSSMTVSGSNFLGNQALGGDSTDPAHGHGGIGGQGAGGAIYATSGISITNSDLSGNDAKSGGGVASAFSRIAASAMAIGGAIVCTGGTLTISSSSLQGFASGGTSPAASGKYGVDGGAAEGGCIWSTVNISISNSSLCYSYTQGGGGSLAGNGGAASGGAIYSSATTKIVNSTLEENSATGGDNGGSNSGSGGAATGGAIDSLGNLTVYDATIATNSTVGGLALSGSTGKSVGAGIYAGESPVLYNSVVSDNQSGTLIITVKNVTVAFPVYDDIAGASANIESQYNFIGNVNGLKNGVNGNQIGSDKPMLGGLGEYGGNLETDSPLQGSPLIDAGKNSYAAGIQTDERGFPRIINGTVDIGAVEAAYVTVTGYVYNDLNGDGTRQSNETALSGWQVYQDVHNSGIYAAGDPSATTDSSGKYTLIVPYVPNMTSIVIRETRQNNWRRTQPAGAYPLGFYQLNESLAPFTNINFGNSSTGLISGTVFHDTNKNGMQDSGEAGLSGWSVEVDQYINGTWNDNVFSTITDASGDYSFVLQAGTYRVHDVLKSGLKATSPANGQLNITLATGGSATSENFGND